MNVFQLIQMIQQYREEEERKRREWFGSQLGQNPRWKGVSDSGGMSLEQLFRMQKPNLTKMWDKNTGTEMDDIPWKPDKPYKGLL